MITKVSNDKGPVMCPVCKKNLDGQVTYAQAFGETKPGWVHRKCLGGKNA